MSSAGGNRANRSYNRSGPSRKGKGKGKRYISHVAIVSNLLPASENTTDTTHGRGNIFDVSESPSVGEAPGEYVSGGELDVGEGYQGKFSMVPDNDRCAKSTSYR